MPFLVLPISSCPRIVRFLEEASTFDATLGITTKTLGIQDFTHDLASDNLKITLDSTAMTPGFYAVFKLKAFVDFNDPVKESSFSIHLNNGLYYDASKCTPWCFKNTGSVDPVLGDKWNYQDQILGRTYKSTTQAKYW